MAVRTAGGNTVGWGGMFETAFSRSQNAMALTDDQRRLIRVNSAFVQLLGHRPSEIIGRHTWDFVAEGPLMSRDEWAQTIARGDVTGDAELRVAQGDIVRVQFGVHPEVISGRLLVLFVMLSVSRWGRHFRREDSEALGDLTPREREVLGMVALGATSPEIAGELHISHNTVRKHVNSAMHKLGARSRAPLVPKASAGGPLSS